MPPKTARKNPPIAALHLDAQTGRTVTIDTLGTMAGSTGQGRSKTPSQLASWKLYWGDGQLEAGTGAPPTSFTHTYAPSVGDTAYILLNVTDVNTLTAQASLTIQGMGQIPSPPTNLTASPLGPTSIQLTWTDTVGNAQTYTIEQSPSGVPTFAVVGTVVAPTTTFTVTGLTPDTTYLFRVSATNTLGTSAPSNTASATTDPALVPPAAPSNLTATPISTTQINLGWTDNAGGTATFEIQRQLTTGGVYSTIATVAATVTSYSDTGLASATSYTYRVRAISIGGASAYSNEASATTNTAPPLAPTNLTATPVSTSSIQVSWTASTGATSYTVERSLHNAGSWSVIATPSGTAITDNGLAASTSYDYRVKATNAGGDSPYSATASATTFTPVPPPQPPAAPSNLAASPVSTTQINLTWVDNSTNETNFEVERHTATSQTPTFVTIATLAAGVTSYADTGLAPSTGYTYRVRATNQAGASAYSNESTATTNTAPPAAPTNLTATPQSTSSILLNWNASASAVSYVLERSPHSAGTFTVIASQAGLTFTDTGLTQATSYDYRVKAINAGGSSPYSAIASATTFTQPPPPTPPAAPTGLTATPVSQTQINLAWTDNSTDETNFQIERKLTSGGTYALIATVAAGVVAYNDGSLTAATSYTYRVRAVNAGGASAYTNEATAVTQSPPPPPVPTAPSNLTATNPSQTSLQLAWTDNSTNETGFSLERAIGSGTYAVIQTLASNVTSYLDNTLTANTTYNYRIRAFNANGNSAYSNVATGTTLPAPPPIPAAPSGLTAQQTGPQQVTLQWVDNATNETGVKIERRVSGGTFAQIAQVVQNVTSYIDTTVTGQTYDYRVAAFNTGGSSPYSNIATITVVVQPPSPNVLAPSDFVYDGCFGVPLTGYVTTQNVFFSWASLGGRVVNGQPRLFMLSSPTDKSQLFEFTPPATLAASPSQLGNNANFRGVMVRDWGNIYGEDPTVGNVKRENGPGNLTDVDGQILYFNGKIYWTFWASYNVGNQNNRCIGLSELNDSTGVATRRGPWRVATTVSAPHATAKFCGGLLALIPAAFATQYLNGRRIHLFNQVSSGVATSPLGMGWFSLMDVVAPFPPEDDVANASAATLLPVEHFAYRLDSRQPITIENWQRRTCDYADPGVHAVTTANVAVGATSIPISDTTVYAVPGAGSQIGALVGTYQGYIGPAPNGVGVLFDYNGKSPASGAGSLTGIPASGLRSIAAAIPVGTVILLGKYDNGRGGVTSDPPPVFGPDRANGFEPAALFWDYVQAPVWITTPSGKQGVLWCGSVGDSVVGDSYGTDDRNHVRYTGQATCPHGQVSPYFQSTGPTATSTVSVGWIYDQNDYAKIAQGQLAQANLVPKYYFRWNSIAPGISVEPRPQGGTRHAWFDDVNAKLYISERNTDLTFGANQPLNIIHRFSFNTQVTPRGPQPGVTAPPGSVSIPANSTTASRQTLINANPNGTTFFLQAGVHTASGHNTPKPGNTFLGAYGAIIDGTGWSSIDLDEAIFQSLNLNVDNVTIQNLELRNYPSYAVNTFNGADNWIVRNCEIHHGRNGVGCGQGSGWTIDNNYIHHCVGNSSSPVAAERGGGYGISQVSNVTFRNNEVAYCGIEQKFFCAGATYGNVTIQNNYFHHNVADGLWIDGNNLASTCTGNICEDNGRTGLTLEVVQNVTVQNNQCRRNATSGILVSISMNCLITQNILEDNVFNLDCFLDCSRINEGGGAYGYLPDMKNNSWTENTVKVPNIGGYYAVTFTVSGTCGAPYFNLSKNNTFNFNHYTVTGNGNWWLWNGSKTWLQWQALPQDVNGTRVAL